MSNVVTLYPKSQDEISVTFIEGASRFIVYVEGAGECPHQHRKREQAERCMQRMRRWLDYQAARADSGLHVGPDGREYVRLIRNGPGPRPQRRPW